MARVNVPVTTLGFQQAAYTTSLTGTNNDLVFTARKAGPGGNDITVEIVVSGTQSLAVSVSGHTITITSASTSGTATSTSAQVKAAVEANVDANSLVSVAHAASNDGTGTVTALAATNLTGGTLGVARPSQTSSDSTNDMYLTGNDGTVMLEVENQNASTQTVDFLLSPSFLQGLDGTTATQTESISASGVRILGPFATGKFSQNAAGEVHFNPSVTTDLKFRAFKYVKPT
jgi:hypothetical protein